MSCARWDIIECQIVCMLLFLHIYSNSTFIVSLLICTIWSKSAINEELKLKLKILACKTGYKKIIPCSAPKTFIWSRLDLPSKFSMSSFFESEADLPKKKIPTPRNTSCRHYPLLSVVKQNNCPSAWYSYYTPTKPAYGTKQGKKIELYFIFGSIFVINSLLLL